MDAIGGYFSLELPSHEEYHKDALRLNTGRNCLEYILRSRRYKKVYIPYYTCVAVLEPFMKLNVDYSFYHIDNNFEITEDIFLCNDEALLYTNYLGLKQHYIKALAEKYGRQLIIDNTQAFYALPIKDVDTFYSCRKFFGVSDGAYLYTDKLLEIDFEQDISYDRMEYLLKRIDISAEKGFENFRRSDDGLDNQPIKKMSSLTHRLMLSIDYEAVAKQRRSNFIILHNRLSETNLLHVELDGTTVPMAYPYFVTDGITMRKELISNKVYVARYWENVLGWIDNSLEKRFVLNILPLPIDQRYGKEEMDFIVTTLFHY